MKPQTLILAVALAVAGLGGQLRAGDAAKPLSLSDSNNAFALDIYGRLKDKERNLAFSPFGISMSLALVYAGARGSTADQMAAALHFDTNRMNTATAFSVLADGLLARPKDAGFDMSIANALWAQSGLRLLPGYLNLIKPTDFKPIDFSIGDAARKPINEWVAKQTRKRVMEIIHAGDISANTAFVATNAIYFLGEWALPFDPQKTVDGPFALADGSTVNVKKMNLRQRFSYAACDGYQLLKLQYRRNRLAMFVVLPSRKDGLGDVEKSLTARKLTENMNELRQVEADVSLPRFSIASEFELSLVLREMGMVDPLTRGKADFSGIDGTHDTWLGLVRHKVVLDVNEKRKEAAAATPIPMFKNSTSSVTFHVDQPFLFLIRDNATGMILLLGRVTDPRPAK